MPLICYNLTKIQDFLFLKIILKIESIAITSHTKLTTRFGVSSIFNAFASKKTAPKALKV